MKPTPEHVWLWHDGYHAPQVSFDKPPSHIQSVEYIRLQTDWNRFKPTPTETPEAMHARIVTETADAIAAQAETLVDLKDPHNAVETVLKRAKLADVGLLSPRERGQVDAFGNECAGICGV